ncbi:MULTISPECIES: RNA polymerase sigma-70 factor [Sphingobacterium]|uniref:RNA polymerase sigma-70 factor n=1 Tax=Sphingobacterium athyrii TaxID=2152717 RepID=A0A363NZC1_9SPHI|nr:MULTISPECIES: RNA polymerase sigma-70 factor [Sphingobacterium]PUV26162.1 RNA polymerase sigma-70 factor [Sphingobacterium athyrii]QIH32974.1 RNA polymerase sigma-70 factor [Sphingobacterium sp. DR205]
MKQIADNFDQLFKAYHYRSFLFAKSFVHIDAVAEDITADALMITWIRMQEENLLSPKSFLLKVIKNKALDYLKHQRIHRQLIEPMDNWDEREQQLWIDNLNEVNEGQIFLKEIKEITQKTLDTMPMKTREIFELSRLSCASGKEIAQQLGISLKGVEYHITKALKVLTVSLKEYMVAS